MKERNKKIQLSLVFIGFLLIILTYYFYPKIVEKKSQNLISKEVEINKTGEGASNIFENVTCFSVFNGTRAIWAELLQLHQ